LIFIIQDNKNKKLYFMEKKEEVYLNSDLTVGDFDVFKISKRVILIEKDKHQLLINKGWIPFCQLDKPDKIVYKKMSKI